MVVHVVSVEYAPGVKNISSECYESREDAVKFIQSRSDNLKQMSDNQWFDQSQGITYRIEFLDLVAKSPANMDHSYQDDESDSDDQTAKDAKLRVILRHSELSKFLSHCESLGYINYRSEYGSRIRITNPSTYPVYILLNPATKSYCIASPDGTMNPTTTGSFPADNSLFDIGKFDKELSSLVYHK